MNSLRSRRALLLVVVVAACGTGRADERAELGLDTSVATVREVTSTVAATGTIEPIRVIDVKSQASGEVMEVGVELGDRVDRGDLLVRIDPRDVRNSFQQAQADLEVAQSRSTIAQRQLARTSTLRDSAVVTEEEYETALLEAANAKASLVRAETNLELASDRMNDVVVTAPIAGTVVEKTVEEGQIITSAMEVSGGTILLRMADLNEVQVRTLVDETDIGAIKPGLPATIKVEAYPDREFAGEVLQIEPQAVVEQNVTLFAVLARIRNEEDLLRPGMNADVEMLIGKRPDVLTLENAAIKMPDEARQLVVALGLDEALLEQKVQAPEDESAPVDDAPAGEGEEDGLPTMAQIQAMSNDERREMFMSLTAAQRNQLMQRAAEAREAEQREARQNPARPKEAFVFVYDESGALTLRPVMIGLSSWEYTEVAAGLSEGDEIVQVPLALIQQRDMLERVRSRTAIPGVSRG
ncbi:MAG: efflux RND transporter periplasmic adaptor subunit [Gemmatimonadota bacterium]|nr:efflux RND transporter periplasmic adaptor subunit [Gemmatimonadota bacterium]